MTGCVVQVDNAYWLWTFQGKCLQKHSKEKFCQLLWRPRPPTLLSPEQIREIKKNLKKYSVDFELKDRLKQTKESKVTFLCALFIIPIETVSTMERDLHFYSSASIFI